MHVSAFVAGSENRRLPARVKAKLSSLVLITDKHPHTGGVLLSTYTKAPTRRKVASGKVAISGFLVSSNAYTNANKPTARREGEEGRSDSSRKDSEVNANQPTACRQGEEGRNDPSRKDSEESRADEGTSTEGSDTDSV